MSEKHYSTTTFLAYIINLHVYKDRHYTFAAEGFYPYGKSNPKSSNPLLIFTDFYQPWQNADPYDAKILQHRLNLKKGILAMEKDNVISPQIAQRLRTIAGKVSTTFFRPVVYAIDDGAAKRGVVAGSAVTGSKEVLIRDLDSNEFELLFDDFDQFTFNQLRNLSGTSAVVDAVDILEKGSP